MKSTLRRFLVVAAVAVTTLSLLAASPAEAAPSQAGASPSQDVGVGRPASEPYPWLARVNIANALNGLSVCTGTLIAPKWALVPAQCLYWRGGDATDVRVGITTLNGSDGSYHVPDQELYNLDYTTFSPPGQDIGLVRLSQPAWQQPVRIADSVRVGDQVRRIGGGYCPDCDDRVAEIDTALLARSECGQDEELELCYRIPESPNGLCPGDPGAPVVKKVGGQWQLVGMSTRVPGQLSDGGCSDIAVSAPAWRDWITDEINKFGGPGTSAPPPGPPPPPPSGQNIALNRPATGSAACNTSEVAAHAFNGSVSGGNADKWCSLAATKYLQVDLGSKRSLNGFVVRHAGAGGERASWNTRDFDIQVSNDDATWSTVVQARGNTANVSNHVKSTSGRYVRLNVIAEQSGNTAARIYEFEVYSG